MFISPAYAQDGGIGGFDIMAFVPLVLIFVVFYFLLIRPQQKKAKDHKAKVAAVRRGDRVVTGGGLIGTVARIIDDNEIIVEIAENTRVRVMRGTLSDIMAKAGPADEAPRKNATGEDDETGSKRRPRRAARKAGGN